MHPAQRLRLALALSLLAAAPAVAELPPTAATQGAYVSPEEMQSRVAAPVNGLATWDAPSSPGVRLMDIRRTKDGEVEVHEGVNDQFVVMEGRATLRVGGTLDKTGQRSTGTGEWRGGVLTGGTAYDLRPGAIAWAPAGLPHQVTVPAGGSIHYLTFKDKAKPTQDR